jgi:hypothetical protein
MVRYDTPNQAFGPTLFPLDMLGKSYCGLALMSGECRRKVTIRMIQYPRQKLYICRTYTLGSARSSQLNAQGTGDCRIAPLPKDDLPHIGTKSGFKRAYALEVVYFCNDGVKFSLFHSTSWRGMVQTICRAACLDPRSQQPAGVPVAAVQTPWRSVHPAWRGPSPRFLYLQSSSGSKVWGNLETTVRWAPESSNENT